MAGPPARAGHGKTPSITITPNCGQSKGASVGPPTFSAGPPVHTITVEGFDFPPSTLPEFIVKVEVEFDGERYATVDVDPDGYFRAVIDPPRRVAKVSLVRATDTTYRHTAVKRYRTPCPILEIDPTCGPSLPPGGPGPGPPDRYSLRVSGTYFGAGYGGEFADRVRLSVAGGRYQKEAETFASETDPEGSFTEVISPAHREAGSYRVVAVDDNDFQAATFFDVPCPPEPGPLSPPTDTSSSSTSSTTFVPSSSTTVTTPPSAPTPDAAELACLPCVTRPGFVVTAVGAGFPAEALVRLWFSPGLGALEVTTDPSGGFRVPVLVLPHDVLGPRLLLAEVAGDPALTSASAALLVVAPPARPSGHEAAQVAGFTRIVHR